jgi:hypothetical protein
MSKILLTEDAPNLAQLIARELEAEGYEVVHAADGASALEKLSSARPDLLILDWMLPKMGRLDVLREPQGIGHPHADADRAPRGGRPRDRAGDNLDHETRAAALFAANLAALAFQRIYP